MTKVTMQQIGQSNQVNLCDTCRHTLPQCSASSEAVIYGDGKGNDNIAACAKYAPITKETPLLMSTENPNGWELERLLDKIREELKAKTEAIIARNEEESDALKKEVITDVIGNNLSIEHFLESASDHQRETMDKLLRLGPNLGPMGKPRI